MERASTAQALFVLGQSGAGKSSLINSIVGAPVAKVGLGEAETTKCAFYPIQAGPLVGCVLVDTPGFFDSRGISNAEILAEIKSAFTMMKVGYIRGVILCHNVTEQRVMIRAVMGALKGEGFNFQGSLVVVLTHYSKFNPSDSEDSEKMQAILGQTEISPKPPLVNWDSKRPVPDQLLKLAKCVEKVEKWKIDWDVVQKIIELMFEWLPKIAGAAAVCLIF